MYPPAEKTCSFTLQITQETINTSAADSFTPLRMEKNWYGGSDERREEEMRVYLDLKQIIKKTASPVGETAS